MRTPKLVIFDWDGTLVDSIEPILWGFELAYRRHGKPCPPIEEVRQTIGMPLLAAFEQLSPGLAHAELVTLYREYWFDAARPPSPWIPGARELLDWLDERGIAMAVATGKSRRGVDHEIASLGLGQRFAATRSADDAQPKPDGEMVEQILEALNVPAEDALVVGDSPLDLGMAAAARVPSCGVLSGVGSREQLAAFSPLALLDSVADLSTLLSRS